MIEQCNEKQLTNVPDPKMAADLILYWWMVLIFIFRLEDDKKAYIERLTIIRTKPARFWDR
jgi:hypothetical protein